MARESRLSACVLRNISSATASSIQFCPSDPCPSPALLEAMQTQFPERNASRGFLLLEVGPDGGADAYELISLHQRHQFLLDPPE